MKAQWPTLPRRKYLMKKIDEMDTFLYSVHSPTDAEAICIIVDRMFSINLENTPIFNMRTAGLMEASSGKEAIRRYINLYGPLSSGEEVREMLNRLFGINLRGIAALEGERISLFSKGQWMTKEKDDLFTIRTSHSDAEVSVTPSAYYSEQTEIDCLPPALAAGLCSIGFVEDDTIKGCCFSTADGSPVKDEFKGQTIGTVIHFIRNSCGHL